ncbi:DUF4411 family protein [Pseudalkalibacillus salsuginis]|uniref:DUF4411 family protein n=1 Tax=Pseudalkalibacillus salsuginis TaxID=2910972 RepID=UPI001F244F5B|nr:DUF4411 family protein [Pseudalkalibacillus salsuginis]MCF6409555.1 DUF4411 family protein [Pseudalkalibacillus salsuginis]
MSRPKCSEGLTESDKKESPIWYFLPEAKSEFASNADAWQIAYAKARGGTLVTHEAYKREKRNRILIPVACKEFGVPYVNTFDMLRQLDVKL